MEPLLARQLNELVTKNDFQLDTGFMSTPHILDILCQYGYLDTAWKVLLQKDCPSWLYEIEQGATTIWENWDAIRPDGQLAGCPFNHYAFGLSAIFCTGECLDCRMPELAMTGFSSRRNTAVRLNGQKEDCINGIIELKWEKDKTRLKISGKIPANTSAKLKLPDGSMKELGNGKFEIETSL